MMMQVRGLCMSGRSAEGLAETNERMPLPSYEGEAGAPTKWVVALPVEGATQAPIIEGR
jgi:hypothetical protein